MNFFLWPFLLIANIIAIINIMIKATTAPTIPKNYVIVKENM